MHKVSLGSTIIIIIILLNFTNCFIISNGVAVDDIEILVVADSFVIGYDCVTVDWHSVLEADGLVLLWRTGDQISVNINADMALRVF
jgi:hypothetical protein